MNISIALICAALLGLIGWRAVRGGHATVAVLAATLSGVVLVHTITASIGA